MYVLREMKTLTWLFATLAASSAVFLLTDRLSPAEHARGSAWSLVFIALAYTLYQVEQRVGWREWLKTALIVAGFLLWAASMVSTRTILSDGAIAAFVADVILSMSRWTHAEYSGARPATEQDEPF